MSKKAFIVSLMMAAFVNPQSYAQEFLEGEIMVSLREELSGSVRKLSTGKIVSGISSLDTLMARHRAEVFERFSDYTEQTRRLYRLRVPSSTDIDRLLQELAKDSSVEYAGRIISRSDGTPCRRPRR